VIQGSLPQVVAQGAVDDEGQTMMFIEAFRAWQTVHGTLPVAVIVFLEDEEESGSKVRKSAAVHLCCF
jgi:acetylornithine deacetylase/succinyl-diaminopimelate desuccinylase-like protein